jgi:signal peptidase I
MKRIGSLSTVRRFGRFTSTHGHHGTTRHVEKGCVPHLRRQPPSRSRMMIPTRRVSTGHTTNGNNHHPPKGGGETAATTPSVTTTTSRTETAAAVDADHWLGTHLARLASAFGLVYVFSEYGVELTICEGPSMLPTIHPQGEIVLLDRATPRLWGMEGGYSSSDRKRQARINQAKHEQEWLKTSRRTTTGGETIETLQPSQQTRQVVTWYEPRIPVNKLPSEGAWERLWTQLTTGISVGDVVVVQHPDRIGTVCKRVCGLPGDIVTKPGPPRRMMMMPTSSNQIQQQQHQRLQRRRSSALLVIPDGFIWLEGDNPSNSSDSRNYGPVPASMIVGRVLCRVWPLRGNALMERGDRPDVEETSQQHYRSVFSSTLVLPAGYDDQVIVRELPIHPENKS